MSSRNISWGKSGRIVKVTSPPSVIRLSRKCGSLNFSQLCKPPRSIIGIVFFIQIYVFRDITSCGPLKVNNRRIEVSKSTDGQSVCLSIEHPCGTCDQVILPVGMLPSEICGLVSVGRPLWRDDGFAICSVITLWSEPLRTRNHTLLSHLRLS
jgi:hypothetical protein